MKIIYVGFGVVSQGLAEIILGNESLLPIHKKEEIITVGIFDKMKGSKIDEDGIDMFEVLKLAEQNDYSLLSDTIVDIPKAIKELDADILIEASFTDIETGQPATSHIISALKSRKHVVTTNKGPFAVAYKEVLDLAYKKKRTVGIEGTVMSGTPVINVLTNGLVGCDITAVSGIMNGTSNYMLTEMESGADYNSALQKAQKLGYAEADPTNDVEGFDTLGKVMILSNVVFSHQLNRSDITVKGISQISKEDLEKASSENKRYKLIGKVWKDDNGKINAQVSPELVSQNDPLYNISGASNALKVSSSILGDTTIVGAGAGKIETGFALYNDMISIFRK